MFKDAYNCKSKGDSSLCKYVSVHCLSFSTVLSLINIIVKIVKHTYSFILGIIDFDAGVELGNMLEEEESNMSMS